MKRERKKDNKGFTLVELIIVIAILAILAATVGLSLTKYIGKSRTASDEAAADTFNTAVEAALANEKAYDSVMAALDTSSTLTIIVNKSDLLKKIVDIIKKDGKDFKAFTDELTSIVGDYFPELKQTDAYLKIVITKGVENSLNSKTEVLTTPAAADGTTIS